MKTAMSLDYKPTRYEGKGFLRNLNIRIHRGITGEMWFGGGFFSGLFIKITLDFITVILKWLYFILFVVCRNPYLFFVLLPIP
jgi:hypothetical protein